MDKKVTGIVSYITIVGWIVAFVAGDKEGAKLHINQGLVLGLATIINSIISAILGAIPFIGWILSLLCSLIGIALFVFIIIGIVYAATDKDAELPIIGAFKLIK